MEQIDWMALEQELIALRREFHRYPEPGWMEFRTTARIIEELEALEIPVRYGHAIHTRDKMYGLPSAQELEAGVDRAGTECTRADLVESMNGGFTGCIAAIEGALPGPTVCVRFNIDCTAIDESASPEHRPARDGWRSLHDECMHASGHDAQIAIGIGLARVLTARRSQLCGRVILLFEPASEGLRGAASLAPSLPQDCAYLIGCYIGLGDLPVGTVAAGVHGFQASTKFDVRFTGEASHAADLPENVKNALAAACSAVVHLQAIPRHSEGLSRLNVGTLHAGTGRNIIPREAVMTLETRGGNAAINSYMEQSAYRICEACAQMHGCTCETVFQGFAGDAACDPAFVRAVADTLRKLHGIEAVSEDIAIDCAEDITTLFHAVQEHGGQATELVFETSLKAPHYSSDFDYDEEVIPLAVRCLEKIIRSAVDFPRGGQE